MSIPRGDDDLIAAIYDAAIEPSRWDEVLRRIVEATKSVSGWLSIRLADEEHLPGQHNIDPFYADSFVQFWHKYNCLSPLIATLAPGALRTATHITQTDSHRASAIFNEWTRPQGWADAVCVGFLRSPDAVGYLAFMRSPDAIWVEPPEWHLLETLAPHLKRAAAIHQLLPRARATTDSLGAAVAGVGFAVFLLTGDCRVLFANTKAEDLVQRGASLRYERGRLAATSPACTARLHALARQGASHKIGESDIGGTLELSCGENCPPLLAHVIPLAPNRTMAILDVDRPAAAVFVFDPAAGLGAQTQRFATRFGLTPAEARVLAEIIAGKGLVAAAARLKITEATARSHAKLVLAKTGTGRQTELIRRFFESALPGSPAGA